MILSRKRIPYELKKKKMTKGSFRLLKRAVPLAQVGELQFRTAVSDIKMSRAELQGKAARIGELELQNRRLRSCAGSTVTLAEKFREHGDIFMMRYWVTQKLPQLYTANHATFPIQIRKITVHICGNIWVTQYDRFSL